MIPTNITREHILKAIEEIDTHGISSNAHSSTYDVVFEGKRYPPKLVVSFANKYVNGVELARDSFKGGMGTDAFKLLKKLGFIIEKKIKMDIQKLYDLKNKFLSEWPIGRLSTMKLEEYTNLDKTSFCYWLEAITTDVGSIWGGSAYKFGIFKRRDLESDNYNDRRKTDGEYSWYGKYGDSKEEVFENIREIIIKIAKYSQRNKLEEIDAIDLGDAVKWKIAFLYGDFNVMNMFNKEALKRVVRGIGIDLKGSEPISELNQLILNKKPVDEDFFEYGIRVWNKYGLIIDKSKEFKKWLKTNKNNTSGLITSYLRSIDILENHFEIPVYEEEDFEVLENLYEDLKLHQKETNGKYYYPEAKSYGEGGFYSAVIKLYIEYLNDNTTPQDQNFFEEVLKKFSNIDLETYFNFLDKIVTHLNLSANDDRVVYSCGHNYLNLNIGQRFVWRLQKSKKKFRIMTSIKYGKESEPYDGIPNHYNIKFDDLTELSKYEDSCLEALVVELARTTKSGYKKFNNSDFEKAVFDKTFRSQFVNNKSMKTKIALNKIFYGPPGTGKTFTLKEKYFPKYTSTETSITKEVNFESVVKDCPWWQVIAIALLELGPSKVADIYKHPWVQKKAELSNSNTVRPTLWGQLQSHTIEECQYVNVSKKQSPLLFNKQEDSTWEIVNELVDDLAPELRDLMDSVNNYQPNPDKEVKRYKFVTFHQSFAYEDFVEGIKPILPEEDDVISDLGYTIEPGVFMQICRDAEKDPSNRYAIFIDEINRGNVSAIFGELITLIEPDKRQGCENEIKVVLPYSKKLFSVPSNLDIYGTMNTADRSVEALDTALRRRFTFKEIMPNPYLLEDKVIGDIKLSEVLETINQRVELLIDRDHTIGHSYFINISNEKELALTFNDKIIPLLQEYFYGDYGKIGLVLGKGFVNKMNNNNKKFATFQYDGQSDFKTPSFELIRATESNIVESLEILLNRNISENTENATQ